MNRTISVLYRYSSSFHRGACETGLPLQVGQLPFLMQVYRHPGITQGIAQGVCMDKGTTARGVAQLERAGLIRRETDENDRRVNHIFATEQALAVREEIHAVIDRLHEVLYTGFSADEVGEAFGLLQRMRGNMERFIRKERQGD
ncbi:MAG: MarR family winged helix-turn-helix transcriptional regulator [Oscillospiraceae bacterium]